MWLLKLPLCILCADLLSGVIHWWEDTYGNPAWPGFGPAVIVPNLRHHRWPREFLAGTYWQRNNTSYGLGIVLVALAWVAGLYTPWLALTLLLAVHANEVHRCAHRSPRENGRIVRWLQAAGVMQSARHHGRHHSAPYDCRYCIMTNVLNPVLDRLRFWLALEWVLRRGFGVQVLRGSALRESACEQQVRVRVG